MGMTMDNEMDSGVIEGYTGICYGFGPCRKGPSGVLVSVTTWCRIWRTTNYNPAGFRVYGLGSFRAGKSECTTLIVSVYTGFVGGCIFVSGTITLR